MLSFANIIDIHENWTLIYLVITDAFLYRSHLISVARCNIGRPSVMQCHVQKLWIIQCAHVCSKWRLAGHSAELLLLQSLHFERKEPSLIYTGSVLPCACLGSSHRDGRIFYVLSTDHNRSYCPLDKLTKAASTNCSSEGKTSPCHLRDNSVRGSNWNPFRHFILCLTIRRETTMSWASGPAKESPRWSMMGWDLRVPATSI